MSNHQFSISLTSRIEVQLRIRWAWIGVLVLAIVSGGCNKIAQWRGASVYAENCAACHGSEGQGQNPARPLGSIAPEQEGWIAPALNGRGHCYLHTRKQIFSIVRDGSPFPGTTMKGFKDKLSDSQIDAAVTYIVSLWDENTRIQYELREKELESLAK